MMPSTASTSSTAPAPAPPPHDERIPLSSIPDLMKLFPPVIQDAIETELKRSDRAAYYDEFVQLYWMGWDEVREAFEREEAECVKRVKAFNETFDQTWVRAAPDRVQIRARLDEEYPALMQQREELLRGRKDLLVRHCTWRGTWSLAHRVIP